MTGLNLEAFLRLLRADLGAWVSLGVIAAILAVMTWTSWGSRRALRKCLFLSIAAHIGLIAYGGASPVIRKALRLDESARKPIRAERPVRITPWVAEKSMAGSDGRPKPKVADWDLDRGPMVMADPARLAAPPPSASAPNLTRSDLSPIAPSPVAPEVQSPATPVVPSVSSAETKAAEPLPEVAEADPSEVAEPVVARSDRLEVPLPPTARLRPGRVDPGSSRAAPSRGQQTGPSLPEPARVDMAAPRVPSVAIGRTSEAPTASPEDLDPGPRVSPSSVAPPSPADSLPSPDLRRAPRPSPVTASGASVAVPTRLADGSAPLAMARVTPAGPSNVSTSRPTVRRSLSDVPPVYRSRLDPNRTTLAQRAGATLASEQAVERALDWLARHQDADDGKWNGGTSRNRDGSVFRNDDSFTIHCPAGEVCFGECFYPEADTALTGLSLLAYLGAGYTHVDGKYTSVVGKGLEFLVKQQKPDGDLRGNGLAVGMYCHSMATLALCEAYALTGDARLRGPVERAVGFLVRARSKDGLAWRYSPGASDSDTSILGWAVMALKSGKSAGIAIPPETQAGIFAWLRKVSKGTSGGLAFYDFEPNKTNVTPTMTAEAWACRQFLEVGGPGPASDEAARYLIQNKTDRGEYNIYYLYYGTLAMYQHGGDAWSTWNGRVRDDVVKRQRTKGHMAGSWDPDDSPYGSLGGRIYGTALATLTLEVYYRFLRLYEPSPGPPVVPRPGGDSGTRRAGFEAGSTGR
jgi:hypothetical protein